MANKLVNHVIMSEKLGGTVYEGRTAFRPKDARGRKQPC